MFTTPTLRELQGHVTPQYAADWREIGVELGLTDAKLREIRKDNPDSVKSCCNRMFSEWLRVDTTASWEKLFTAIESPGVSGGPVRGIITFCKLICCNLACTRTHMHTRAPALRPDHNC